MGTILKARPLVSNPATEAKVDIICPFYGQYQKLMDLCKSIWYHTRSNRYRLYLVDDCSPNKTYIPAFKDAPYTTIIQNAQQRGFGGSLLEGFNAGQNDWVVFIHSDCVIHSAHWLEELLHSHLRNPKAGIVAPRTNNPVVEDRRLQAERQDPPRNDVVLEKGYLPLYCALCRRDVFHRINGFVKQYPFRYYEDEELAHRMRAYGFDQVVSGKSWVYHHGGATVGALLKLQEGETYHGPDYRKIIEENRLRCIQDLKGLSRASH